MIANGTSSFFATCSFRHSGGSKTFQNQSDICITLFCSDGFNLITTCICLGDRKGIGMGYPSLRIRSGCFSGIACSNHTICIRTVVSQFGFRVRHSLSAGENVVLRHTFLYVCVSLRKLSVKYVTTTVYI